MQILLSRLIPRRKTYDGEQWERDKGRNFLAIERSNIYYTNIVYYVDGKM